MAPGQARKGRNHDKPRGLLPQVQPLDASILDQRLNIICRLLGLPSRRLLNFLFLLLGTPIVRLSTKPSHFYLPESTTDETEEDNEKEVDNQNHRPFPVGGTPLSSG